MTRWPACCSGESLAISPASALSAASWAAVGTAAAPCTASADCCGDGAWLVALSLAAPEVDARLAAEDWPLAGFGAPAVVPPDPQPVTIARAPAATTTPAWRQRRSVRTSGYLP